MYICTIKTTRWPNDPTSCYTPKISLYGRSSGDFRSTLFMQAIVEKRTKRDEGRRKEKPSSTRRSTMASNRMKQFESTLFLHGRRPSTSIVRLEFLSGNDQPGGRILQTLQPWSLEASYEDGQLTERGT